MSKSTHYKVSDAINDTFKYLRNRGYEPVSTFATYYDPDKEECIYTKTEVKLPEDIVNHITSNFVPDAGSYIFDFKYNNEFDDLNKSLDELELAIKG